MRYREIARHVLLETVIWAVGRGFHEADANSIALQHGAYADLTERQLEKLRAAMRKEVEAMFEKAVKDGVIADGQIMPWPASP